MHDAAHDLKTSAMEMISKHEHADAAERALNEARVCLQAGTEAVLAGKIPSEFLQEALVCIG